MHEQQPFPVFLTLSKKKKKKNEIKEKKKRTDI